ncbi:MAG: LPS export ABC transporter periplasmic protein LptC [Alphaproteobacteria bacterium]
MSATETAKRINHVKQHSKIVHLARISVPIATFFLLVLLFWIPKTMQKNQLSIDAITQDNQVAMDSNVAVLSQPRYQGRTGNWQYDISAYVANNASIESERIDFISPQGVVNIDDGAQFDSQANTGSWFSEQEVLELTGHASLLHSDGYYVESDRVQIDVKGQEVRTPGNARGEAEFGKFEADKIRIEDGGNTIWLLGHSHVTLLADKKPTNIQGTHHSGDE